MRSIPSVVLATTLLSLLPTAVAEAKDYCVAKPRCSGATLAAGQLQTALTEAQSNGTADRVFLGDALFAGGPYSYRSAEPVEIRGVSGTTLQAKSDDRIVLTVDGAAATVADLKIELVRPASAALRLIGGSASGITAVQTLGTPAGVGIVLDDGATLTGASVAMHEGVTPAVGTISGSGTVRDSVLVSAGSGVTVAQGAQVTVVRATITAPLGIQAVNSRAVVRDTLIDGRGGSVNPGGDMTAGIAAQGVNGGVAEVDAARVTIVGDDDGAQAIGAYALGVDSGTARLRIADSAIAGTGIPLVRVAQGGTADLTADRVAHRDRVEGEPFEGGPGTTTETNRLPAPSGFADAARGDFHLLPGSPLVDAGDPAFAPAADSDRDVSGAPRLADGDGDCSPRVDVGAYEYQRVLPHAVATASTGAAQAGTAVGFSAAGSCAADPAAPLTYVWQFDDGGSAAGPAITHAFATAGTHSATVTAIDPAGKTASASAQVAISAPAAQPQPPSRPNRGDRTPPTLTNLRAPARIVAGSALPKLRAGRKTPAFAFTLSEPATVRLQFARRGRDKRFHAVRTTVSVRTGQGGSRLGFGGRLTRRARLKPGSYRVTFVATDAAGNRSQAATVRFELRAKKR